ncbi:uncharacterized protein EV154DRAFT_488886 [Mucor mucedo]|uniref:uncharacterized protein n=1 Tax=Mucor mucedo TaxID=29922 RepID=UPI00221F8EEA|nr:uncharacterized protein EV154DRAFT_488886 [Mucor mucedo]KAI7864540.1 hypothetical protein EV154DRAFT_488886 [Mucor mucedo]
MFDLYSIKAPSSKKSLQGFVAYFDELLSILNIFDEHCLTFTCDTSIPDSCKRKSLSQEAFDSIYQNQKAVNDDVIHPKEWYHLNLNRTEICINKCTEIWQKKKTYERPPQ